MEERLINYACHLPLATTSREDDGRKMLVSISPVRLVNIKLSLGLVGSRQNWGECFIKADA